jgi:hypothetical protein
MRFYNRPHTYYCGIDLHVKTMYVCILDRVGQVLVHRNLPSTPAALLEVVAPYREDLVVAAECMFTWYWMADVSGRRHHVRARPCAGDESHPRWQGQERPDRLPQDRRVTHPVWPPTLRQVEPICVMADGRFSDPKPRGTHQSSRRNGRTLTWDI